MVGYSRFYFRDPTAPVPNQPRALSVIAFVERDDEVLLERRADAPLWGLIAGHVNDDENLEEALRREIHEETGLAVAAYDLFGTFTDPSRIVAYSDGTSRRRRLASVEQRLVAADGSMRQRRARVGEPRTRPRS